MLSQLPRLLCVNFRPAKPRILPSHFGDTGVPSAAIAYLFGMMPPSSNASVVRVNLGFVGAGAEGVCAIIPTAASTNVRLAIHDFIALLSMESTTSGCYSAPILNDATNILYEFITE